MKAETVSEAEVIKFNPLAIEELQSLIRVPNLTGLDVAITLYKVGRDLADGIIEKQEFLMNHWSCKSIVHPCKTTYCIGGWVAARLNLDIQDIFSTRDCGNLPQGLFRLFSPRNKSDPQLAALAVNRYLFEYSNDPWGTRLVKF